MVRPRRPARVVGTDEVAAAGADAPGTDGAIVLPILAPFLLATAAMNPANGTPPLPGDAARAETAVVRCALRSATRSESNRRLARELVWSWVGSRWPRLVPPACDLEQRHLQRSFPGRRLSVSANSDGSLWALEVACSERDGTRTWTTRAVVADTGEADVMGLQTTCSEPPSRSLVVAPPRLLSAWVERLDLDDGGVPVMGEPRMVASQDQLAALCGQLLLDRRRLPVIALTNRPESRYYGVDPRGLAEAVVGLAHVACVAPDLVADLTQRLGTPLGVAPGAARIYGPGFTADAAPKDHPLVRPGTAPGGSSANDPGVFRRRLCRRLCAMSVDAGTGFEALLEGSAAAR